MYLIDGVEGSQNLRIIYDESNKKYFGNILPKIKIRWDGRLKRAIGRAGVKWISVMGGKQQIDMRTVNISMSKSFDLQYNDVVAVMLHEMAHILLFLHGNLTKHHGTSQFDGVIKNLRKESGLNVPYKESSFKSSPKSVAMDGYLALIHASGGIGITVYSTPFIKKNWRQLHQFLDDFIPSGKVRKMELWKVKHQVIKNSTKKRSLKRISWSLRPNDEIEAIKKTGFQWASYGAGKNYMDGKKAGL
jgi:predicted SprT family Zn-dependent metalloprotease